MSSRAQRSNIKTSSASSVRQAMNKRRHELSSKIRKTKKSHQLNLKRRHTTDTTSSQVPTLDASSPVSANECLQQYLASPTIFTLSELQTNLATSKQSSSLPLDELPTQHAEQLLQNLLTYLASTNAEECLTSLRILTNLAAMECPDSYYSNRKSWCSFMLSSNLLTALVPLLSSQDERIQEQTCWVIGNIAGDSQLCRDQLIAQNVIGALLEALRRNGNNGIKRNIVWSLTNIARGTELAMPFVQSGFGVQDILTILLSEEDLERKPVSAWDVRKELYWLLAFLTCREDEVIEGLMNDQVLLTLSRHFDQVTTITLEKRDRGSIFKSAIPLIRIFGNLATAADGKYIPGIINADNHSIVHTLAKWLQVRSPCGETMTIATEVTWVAGALLCDNGYESHPSTTIACPVLVPPLCRVLLKGTFTLQWKREVLNAIWNALAAPPGSISEETIVKRDSLLSQIFREKGMVRALVGMLVCLDVDAIRPAINMLDAMHRRMENYDENAHRILKEAECEHALEKVCDSATSNASYGGATDWQQSEGGMDYCAEMAANLIDDFYGEENDAVFEDCMAPTSGSGSSFEFGLQSSSRTFNFTSSHDSAQDSITSDPMSSPNGRGRGRGRGRAMPAWMETKI